MIKLGEEVVVIANNSKHDFEMSEVVKRVPSLHDTEDKLCFYSENSGSWHMMECDYVPLGVAEEMTEHEKTIYLLKRAKQYVGRVNSIGAQVLSKEISEFLRECNK